MLKFQIIENRTTGVDVTGVPSKTRPTQWDQIAEELTQALSGDWRVAQIGGGYWKIFDKADPARGSHGVRRCFTQALGEATGLAVSVG